jgi:hypothetical protein
MSSLLNRAGMTLRWGLVGLVSGLLSCAMAQSRVLYLTREQKTIDHIVWPGVVFALVVLLPMSRWAADAWLQTTLTLLASAAVYPIAWQIAAISTIRPSNPAMIPSFTIAGLLGSAVLASVLLWGRPHWLKSASTTVILGAAVGLLMGAHLLLAPSHNTTGTVLGVYMVLWQTLVACSLGRGVKASSSPLARSPDRAPDPAHAASGNEHGVLG